MARVPLTIVTDNYDRIQALRDGEVKVEGCEVTYLNLPPSSTFPRLMRYQEFQVSEMSLSTYMLARSRATSPTGPSPSPHRGPSPMARSGCAKVGPSQILRT